MISDEQLEKLYLFEDAVITHPRMKAVFHKFDALRFQSRRLRGMQAEELLGVKNLSWMGMFASRGSGKTTIINEYLRKVLREEQTADFRPVMCVNLSTNVTVKGFYTDILKAFGDPNSASGTQQHLEQRCYRYLIECGVELLIIDEVHHLMHSETNKIRWDVAELFKNLLNAKTCSLVLSGIEKVSFLNSDGGQLARRAIPSVKLSPLNLEIEGEQKLFLGFLAKLDQRLVEMKITDRSNGFLEGKLPGAFYQVSGGVIGIVCHVIMQALTCCYERGASRISLGDLVEATDLWAIDHGFADDNPFAGIGGRN